MTVLPCTTTATRYTSTITASTIHSHEGDALAINRDGVNIHSHDGTSLAVGRGGVDLHATDAGNPGVQPDRQRPA